MIGPGPLTSFMDLPTTPLGPGRPDKSSRGYANSGCLSDRVKIVTHSRSWRRHPQSSHPTVAGIVLESFVLREAVEACVSAGVREQQRVGIS